MKRSGNRRGRLLAPALLALMVGAGSAQGAGRLGIFETTGRGADAGAFFGPGPTTGWLTALGLASVGVVGVMRRRHRAVT